MKLIYKEALYDFISCWFDPQIMDENNYTPMDIKRAIENEEWTKQFVYLTKGEKKVDGISNILISGYSLYVDRYQDIRMDNNLPVAIDELKRSFKRCDCSSLALFRDGCTCGFLTNS